MHDHIKIGVFSLLLIAFVAVSSAATAEQVPGSRPAVNTLVIAEKNRVIAKKDKQVILLLDFYPNKPQLDAAGARAAELILVTAQAYAEEYLHKPEYSSFEAIVAFVVYIKNMDEYNRASYGGMQRFGTLTFTRDGVNTKLVENKLAF